MVDQQDLRQRTDRFLRESQLAKTRLARAIGIERETYYRWMKGKFDFSDSRAEKLSEFLKKFNY